MIELRTLGELDLRGPEPSHNVEAVLKQPKRLAFLVYVVVESRQSYVRRDAVLGVFWPDQPEERARASLRQYVYSLRQDLTPHAFPARADDRIAIDPQGVSCDVHNFDTYIKNGDLTNAVALYRGDFLENFYLRDNLEFDRWLETERTRLERAYLTALDELARQANEAGEFQQAAEWFRKLTEKDPYKTKGAIQYMAALAAAGQRADALKHAELYSKAVQRDLEASPSPEVLAYAEGLRKGAAQRIRKTLPHKSWDPEAVQPRDHIQGVLGARYELEFRVGGGGMATVYLAQDTKLDRKVAIKVLRPEFSAAVGAERFLREILVTARLQHPCIVPLFDSGNADGLLYYIMPYFKGQTLRVRLNREGRLDLGNALQITHDVAGALEYAHAQGIVHRDIKPANILLGPSHPLVSDFGIARALTAAGGEHLTATGQIIGTPGYMSPEQGAGDRGLDGRTDQFSLACVLYEMLTGALPYGNEDESILSQQLTEPPPSVRKKRREVPTSVDRAISRALASVPADRFSTILDFTHELFDR